MVSAIDAAPGRLFPAFERHAAVMVKAAVALREMVAGGHVCRVRTSNVAPLQSAQPRQIKSRDKSPNRGVGGCVPVASMDGEARAEQPSRRKP